MLLYFSLHWEHIFILETFYAQVEMIEVHYGQQFVDRIS